MAQDRQLAYHISPNGPAHWYWDITLRAEIIARGLASTRVQARADAIEAAASYVKSLEDFPPVPEDVLE
jgi:hypothetical protein